MGGVGSDIAVDAADIALVDDEVKELPHLLTLFKKMIRKIIPFLYLLYRKKVGSRISPVSV